MHGMPGLVQHEVGDVHNVVDGAQADKQQFVFQPVGTLLHGNTPDGES